MGEILLRGTTDEWLELLGWDAEGHGFKSPMGHPIQQLKNSL